MRKFGWLLGLVEVVSQMGRDPLIYSGMFTDLTLKIEVVVLCLCL